MSSPGQKLAFPSFPEPPSFVFFHVGDDVLLPSMLCDSIRWTNPDSQIIFCTDAQTPDIPGVSHRVNVVGNRTQLMAYRLRAFSISGLKGPAIYLDTDMLVTRPVSPSMLIGLKTIAMCRRSFNLGGLFNGRLRNLDFSEYHLLPLDEVYPYVACCTVTQSPVVWGLLYEMLLTLSPKFHDWYGDQEVLKEYAVSNPHTVGELPEHTYACLPEAIARLPRAAIIHFKGASRKSMMRSFYMKMRAQRNSRL